ncbi:DUF4238 domain-containing protein [Frigoribacterium sp. Leaf44]|uniref:DUF4238 domain-containing protein n=1 Tax=Frigoribacterium sp. Leaf44 TaxID=1736220 RepID=UPI0007004B52|nr:DUF4238 domain-containing protein [Frigoribacterium sp. Leaf44]KQN42459.1 hypothetical protein ASE87_08145 [Frigoribacterium sp. Leaf44]
MTPVAKLHHFVPQAYLRGFATEKERIVAVPLDTTRSPFTTVVKNVGAQTHFHTIPGVEEPDGFEKFLSSVEGEASAIIRRIEGGEFPLPQEDRMTLSHYLALQAVRGPDTRRTIEHLQAKMIRLEVGAGGRQNVGKWIQGYFGFDADEDQQQRIWDEATQPGGPPLTIAVGDHIRHMVETAEELTVYLVTRPWSLHQFDRRSLITCDAPVSLIRGRDDAEPWMGVGFANASAISVPLTRKLGLIMSDPLVLLERFEDGDPGIQQVRDRVVGGQLDAVQVGTTAVERLFNEHTAHNAREYIYRHPDDQRFVPAELPGPNLITMDAHGLLDADFDGEPWFGRDRGQSDQD